MQNFKYFTDKRVDKICLEKGLTDYEVFYSPIIAWIYVPLLLLYGFVSGGLIVFSYFKLLYVLSFLALYLFITYLLYAKLSHSFVVTANQIIVINPNFVFKKYREYKFNDIKKVEINSSKNPLLVFFLIFNQRFVAIKTQNEYKRFYCAGLDVAGYEDYDNLTEKTLDDLHSSLQKKGIEMKLHF